MKKIVILILIVSSYECLAGPCHFTFIDIHEPNVCPGEFVNINVINPIGNQLWFDGSTDTYLNFIAVLTFSGFVINDAGTVCADTINFTILVYPKAKPVVNVFPNDTVCKNSMLTLEIINPIGNVYWLTGDTTNVINIQAVSDFTITAINDYAGYCPDTTSISIKVLQPFSLGDDIDISCQQNQILNLTLDYNPQSILWSNGSTSSSITISEPGFYNVSVDNGYCIFTDSINISSTIVNVGKPFIPNAFTPNNDSMNEIFRVEGVSDDNFTINIFNRWGSLIFHSNNSSHGWNGTHLGYESEQDIYFWKVNYMNPCTHAKEIKLGTVLLIR